jgi:CubicO group peptidase (beta-lactamase class C family)
MVTVRRLLDMTAAIPHGNFTYLEEKDAREREAAGVLKDRAIVVFPPGEVHLYSNFAYAVLERLVEEVSGKPFPEFLAAELFGPLGMRGSFVGQRASAAARYDGRGAPIAPRYPLPRSSRSLHSTVEDLLTYARLHLGAGRPDGARVLGEATLENMHRLRPDVPHALFALGIGSLDLGGGTLWLLTNGRDSGVQASLSMIPSERLAVVCLVNSTGDVADDIAFRITDAAVPRFLGRLERVKEDYMAWAERPYAPAAGLSGEWGGSVYSKRGRVPLRLLFTNEGDIRVRLGGGKEETLNGVRYSEGLLTGDFTAELQTEEAARGPHRVTLSLRLKAGRLSGFAASDFTNARGNFTLASYVRLARR